MTSPTTTPKANQNSSRIGKPIAPTRSTHPGSNYKAPSALFLRMQFPPDPQVASHHVQNHPRCKEVLKTTSNSYNINKVMEDTPPDAIATTHNSTQPSLGTWTYHHLLHELHMVLRIRRRQWTMKNCSNRLNCYRRNGIDVRQWWIVDSSRAYIYPPSPTLRNR